MKIGILLISLASLPVYAFAQEAPGVPKDAGDRLLRRLALQPEATARVTRFYIGKYRGQTCFISIKADPENSSSPDLRSKFVSVHLITPYANNQGALFQGRFHRDGGQAVEFNETGASLQLKAIYDRGSGSGGVGTGWISGMFGMGGEVSSMAEIQIQSDASGRPQKIEVGSWSDTFVGRMRKESGACGELKPITQTELADHSWQNDLIANSVWKDGSVERFMGSIRESLGESSAATQSSRADTISKSLPEALGDPETTSAIPVSAAARGR